jgi:mRNA-degrading endonuclease RelE of RelBE toxin-antitoxin system
VSKLTNRARKDIDELPVAMQERARALIDRLDAEPALGTKLLGKLAGKRSLRLGRSHRIIYRFDDDAPLVLTISPRRDAYK